MKRRRGPRRRASIYLLGVCVALALVVYLELDQAPPFSDGVASTDRSTSPEDAPPPPAAFSLPPLAAYAVIVDRPLFSARRRPPVEEDEASPSRFILTGVIISAGERLVLLRRVGSEAIIRASEGEEIDGWRIEAIAADRVVLRHGDAVEEVGLEDAPPPARRTLKIRKDETTDRD